jgi:hypothetical protein
MLIVLRSSMYLLLPTYVLRVVASRSVLSKVPIEETTYIITAHDTYNVQYNINCSPRSVHTFD